MPVPGKCPLESRERAVRTYRAAGESGKEHHAEQAAAERTSRAIACAPTPQAAAHAAARASATPSLSPTASTGSPGCRSCCCGTGCTSASPTRCVSRPPNAHGRRCSCCPPARPPRSRRRRVDTRRAQPGRPRSRPVRSPRPQPAQTPSVPARHPRRLHGGHRPAPPDDPASRWPAEVSGHRAPVAAYLAADDAGGVTRLLRLSAGSTPYRAAGPRRGCGCAPPEYRDGPAGGCSDLAGPRACARTPGGSEEPPHGRSRTCDRRCATPRPCADRRRRSGPLPGAVAPFHQVEACGPLTGRPPSAPGFLFRRIPKSLAPLEPGCRNNRLNRGTAGRSAASPST